MSTVAKQRKASQQTRISDIIVIQGISMFDGVKDELQKEKTIVAKNGIITEIGNKDEINIPDNSKILDFAGMTVIPGLIDSHVHLTQSGVDDYMRPFAERMITKLRRNAYLTLKSGITTVRNMPGGSSSSVFSFKNKIDQNKITGPRMLVCGPALSPPYGYFSLKMFIPLNKLMVFIISHIMGAHGLSIDIDSKDAATKAVKRLKGRNVDFIKTVSPGSAIPFADRDEKLKEELLQMGVRPKVVEAGMKEEILQVIVRESHSNGLKVAVHNVCWPEGFKAAVMAGADSLEHTPLGLLDEETFDAMRNNNTYWVPTAFTFYNWCDYMEHPEAYNKPEVKELVPEPFHTLGRKSLDKVRESIRQGNNPMWKKFYDEMDCFKSEYFPYNLQQAMKRNIKIVAGVDAGASGSGYVPHGLLYKELELFVEQGMNEYEAIRTATLNAAELIGMDNELGSIEVGKRCDLVVLENSPIDDISNLRKVSYVIKDGAIVFQK